MSSASQWAAAQPPSLLRTSLPSPQQEPKQISIWTLAKDGAGKDITGPMPLPAEMHVPLSDLEQRAEDIEYTELLDEAAELPKDSVDRLLKVAAYALTPYAAARRAKKPLFCVPGETFEAVYPTKGVRYISEAVQADPLQHAGHMEGRAWTLATDDQPQPKLSLAGTLDFNMNWALELTFTDGDQYTWSKAITSINNMILGELYVTHHGMLSIKQAATGRVCHLKFKDPSIVVVGSKARKKANQQVTGWIEERGKKQEYPKLSGDWNTYLCVEESDKKQRELWRVHPPGSPNIFDMTVFAISLTDRPPALMAKLPPTDSRRREDIHLLEQCIFDRANVEKKRLEQLSANLTKQFRAEHGKKANIPPRWFAKAGPDDTKPGQAVRWRYQGGYWEARDAGNWAHLPHLFEQNLDISTLAI